MSSELEKLRAYLSGEADEQTHREIREELGRPGSPLAHALGVARRMSRQWLGEVPGARDSEAGRSPEPAPPVATWLSAAFAPVVSRDQAPPSVAAWAAALVLVWMRHLTLRSAGAINRSGPGPSAAESMASSADLASSMQNGSPVTLGREEQWVHVSTDGEVVRVRAGRSPADAFEAFRIEFQREGTTVVGVLSVAGVATLTPADFARAVAEQADTVVIRVIP